MWRQAMEFLNQNAMSGLNFTWPEGTALRGFVERIRLGLAPVRPGLSGKKLTVGRYLDIPVKVLLNV
jgi:hypothetical protein